MYWTILNFIGKTDCPSLLLLFILYRTKFKIHLYKLLYLYLYEYTHLTKIKTENRFIRELRSFFLCNKVFLLFKKVFIINIKISQTPFIFTYEIRISFQRRFKNTTVTKVILSKVTVCFTCDN